MNFKVQGNFDNKRQEHKAIVDLSRKLDVREQLNWAAYTAPVGVALCHESMVAFALFYWAQKNQEVLSISSVMHTAQTINEIFKNEFLIENGPSILSDEKIRSILSAAHYKKVANVDFDKDEVSLLNDSTNQNIQ